jgi:hypothetical protein
MNDSLGGCSSSRVTWEQVLPRMSGQMTTGTARGTEAEPGFSGGLRDPDCHPRVCRAGMQHTGLHPGGPGT